MHKKKTEEMEADHQEFNRLIRENQAILYDFIKCRILDKSLAQDVLQETLYIAYKKMGSAEGTSQSDRFSD